ncbi:MAG: carboxypeptidase-like regulatory domain-containing protein [Acidobacteriota bacterium]
MTGYRHRAILLMIVCLLTAVPRAGTAQPARGTITGTVSDQRGTRLARVTVVIRSRETGAERPAVTGPDGTFSVGGLAPGIYDITVTDPGFVAFRREVTLAGGDSVPVEIQLGYTVQDFSPVTDRWRLRFPLWQRYPPDQEGEYPFVPGRGWDPYDQNALKGDLPVIGDEIFMVLSAVSETPFEYRKVPTPAGVSTQDPGSEEFFGRGEQYALLPSAILSFEMFRGNTAFKPRDWAFRITPQFNLNYVNTKERNVLNITPELGRNRRREHLALQEAFGEVKLFDVGPNYDFVSVRAGIQPFTSDFRGFLFRDTNLGVRVFGNWGRNRNQWNIGYFDQLEKETNSELNLLERRNQKVYIANYYRQDFLTQGYNISPSFHANIDRGEEFFFDENGFLVRPSPIGLIKPHAVKAYYAGFAGDGHLGRLNITHQFYQAFGEDEFNGISGRKVDINAQFAAVELSIDKDWYRPRASVVFASGDGDPDDEDATGFDAILDNPNIAGGPFSFWARQGLRLAQTGVSLVGRSSVLPTLRSSKTEGQANFVNPGVLLVNAGFDAELTTKLRTTLNVNYLRFHRTETMRRLLFQGDIDKAIGLDYSVGFQYRPALNDNLLLTGGVSVFTPGKGFKQILTNDVLYTPFVVVTLAY